MDTKQRVILNSACNVTASFSTLIIGVVLTPFLLKRLGRGGFSIIPLVMSSVLPFFDIFTTGIQASVGRYVTFHRARQEVEEANRYFNTSFFILLGLCVLAALPILALSYYFPSVFDVKGWERQSQWTMLVAGAAFMITSVTAPYGVGMYCTQRFDIRSAFQIAGSLAKLATIVLLFRLVGANPVYVSVGLVVAAALQGTTNVITAYRMLPGLRTSGRLFSRAKVKDVSAFSFFSVISRLSTLLFVHTDYLLINWLINKESVTIYNLGALWLAPLRGLMGAAVFVLAPLVTILDAAARLDRIGSIFLRVTRVALLVICPVAIFFCVLAKPFMTVWVGGVKDISQTDIVHAVQVLWVLVLPLTVNLSVLHALNMFPAMGRVRVVALVTLGAALANIGLSIWLAVGLKLGILGIALGSTVCLLAKNALFTPWYMCRLCHARLSSFYRLFPGPIIACLPGAGLAILAQYVVEINDWLGLFLVGSSSVLVYLFVLYFWFLRAEERAQLREGWARLRGLFARDKTQEDD